MGIAAIASSTNTPPRIDGVGDDLAWSTATRMNGFVQHEPTEGAEPSHRTEFQVAYDEESLYIFVRAFDSAPDSIVHALARRDVSSHSDEITLGIDSYFDRRTGYLFAANVAGVKRDMAVYNDGDQSDSSWDAVWEVATSVDSLGWTAEFRIPFSQLRFPEAPSHTFGLAILRTISRYPEVSTWPMMSRNRPGDVSQFGSLIDLNGIGAGRTLETTPYLVTRNSTQALEEGGFGRAHAIDLGLDLKSRLAPNLTLNATINPDFGQVEADPAVLNLGAFETFQSERRPFFVEGTGTYRFSLNCYVVVDCGTNEGLFYSRRIGRTPSLRGEYGDASTPTATPIAAAAKLTGRTEGGLAFGALTAVTRRIEGVGEATVEPLTSHTVLSAEQDFRGGEGGVRLVVTGVNRSLDEWTSSRMHSSAYAAAVSFRNRFGAGNYEVAGLLAGSRISGSAKVIAATQRNSVHYFQQPDDDLTYDPTRTSLSGYAGEIKFGKYGGGITRFETSLVQHSAGFDVNDLGFLRRADRTEWSSWGSLVFNSPTSAYLWARVNGNLWRAWNTSGDPIQTGVNFNGHMGLLNNWDIHGGFTLDNLGGNLCDRCTRGGPLLRRSSSFRPWWRINTDTRRTLAPSIGGEHTFGDEGRSRFTGLFPAVNFRLSTRLEGRLGASYRWNDDASQWIGNHGDEEGVTHHLFARLDQETAALSLRVNYTHTPDLTLQFYAEPFVSRGRYTEVREVSSTPRAKSYADRFTSYMPPPSFPTGVHYRQMNANLVVRWEYAPGSSLFVAWAHGRQRSEDIPSELTWREEFEDIFGLHPNNTFLIKVAHWFNW